MSSDDKDAHWVRITGRVQGVYYRAWARGEAERLGLTGWVRNNPDGSVSALIIGTSHARTAMLQAMEDGPPDARVEAVEAEPVEPNERPAGFEIR